MQLIKWVILLLVFYIFAMMAIPFLLVAHRVTPHKTNLLIKDVGEMLAIKCRIDLRKGEK